MSIKFPLEFKPGMGYSHNSGPPVGGWEMTTGKGFYGQPLNSILPAPTVPVPNFGFGSHKSSRSKHSSKKSKKTRKSKRKMRRHFGYPLMNTPDGNVDMNRFPLYPVGPGNTPGGTGGVLLQGLPNFQSFWGFGSKKRRNSKRNASKKRKSRKSRK